MLISLTDLRSNIFHWIEHSSDKTHTPAEKNRQQKISGDQVYQFLLFFDRLYNKFFNTKHEFSQLRIC